MAIKEPKPKGPHGGARPGSGRKPGSRNKETLRREAKAREVLDKFFDEVNIEGKTYTPLETLLLVMHLHLRSGNLSGAAVAARDAAPFVHSRLDSSKPEHVIPPELMPDHPIHPDEIGPENIFE